MGFIRTKPVFGVSDKAIFKLACSATETSLNIEIFLLVCLDIILSVKGTKKALIRLRVCAGWSAPLFFANPVRQVFLRRSPYGIIWFPHAMAGFMVLLLENRMFINVRQLE